MTKLTAKSSTIFISSGDTTRVYHSISEVPAPLRRKLEQSTRGGQSATILIADRRGREELVRALQSAGRRLATTPPKPVPAVRLYRRVRFKKTLGFLIPVLIGILVWLFIANSF